jgi:MFS family permease
VFKLAMPSSGTKSEDQKERTRKTTTGLVFAASFIDGLAIAVMVPVIPFLTKEMHAAASVTGVTFALFPCGSIFGTPLAGYIADRVGRKTGVMFVLAAKAAGCLSIGLSWTPYLLMASSFATGLSGASYPVARAVLADVYSKDELPSMFGYLSAAMATPYVFGPMVAGLLGKISYRLPFYAVSAFSLAIFLLVASQMDNAPPTGKDKPALSPSDLCRVHPALSLLVGFLTFGIQNAFLSSFTPTLVEAFSWEVGLISVVFAVFSGSYVGSGYLVAHCKLIATIGLRAGALLGATCVVLAHLLISLLDAPFDASAATLLALMMAFWSFGKNVTDPAFMALSADAVPSHVSGTFQGLVSAVGSVGQMSLTFAYHQIAGYMGYRTAMRVCMAVPLCHLAACFGLWQAHEAKTAKRYLY